MKKLISILILAITFLLPSEKLIANEHRSLQETKFEILQYQAPIAIVLEKEFLKKDCKVNINIELADGTQIEGSIVIYDISWWKCTKMQVGSFFNNLFN